MRTMNANEDYQSSAAAPYVATLGLAGGAALGLALPGIGERVLIGADDRGGKMALEVIPPSSSDWTDPDTNPAARAARWRWRSVDRSSGLHMRHEKGLGADTGLGDRAAAGVAAALAVAALTGRSFEQEELGDWLRAEGVNPSTDGACAVASAWHGGAWLDVGDGPRAVVANPELRVVYIMPGEGVPAVRHVADSRPLTEESRLAIARLDLTALTESAAPLVLDHAAWRGAISAARTAGAEFVHVANGGHTLVALTAVPERAGTIRIATIDAFAQQGVWSRGRAGPLNHKGGLQSVPLRSPCPANPNQP